LTRRLTRRLSETPDSGRRGAGLAVEVHRTVDGAPVRDDSTRSAVLGCGFERLDADHLRVVTPGGTLDISP
jgi:hypothetical protein